MQLAKVLTYGLFGLKNPEKSAYKKEICELKSKLEISNDYINHKYTELFNLNANTNNLLNDLKSLSLEIENTTFNMFVFFSRMLPWLTDKQIVEIYEILDPEGWSLYNIVEKLTGKNTNELHYEDNRGMFENLNGYQTIQWLENMAFTEAEYEIVEGTCYERTIFKKIDKTTKKYQEYKKKKIALLREVLLNGREFNEMTLDMYNDGFLYLLNALSRKNEEKATN